MVDRGLYCHNFLVMSLKTRTDLKHCTLSGKTEDLHHKLTVFIMTCEMYCICGDDCGDQPAGGERIILLLHV